jgi:hypothetical protein
MYILNEPLLDDPVPKVPEFDMAMLGNIVSDSCTSRTARTSSSNFMNIPKQTKGEKNAVMESISPRSQAFTSGIRLQHKIVQICIVDIVIFFRTANIKEKTTEKASTDEITRNSISEKQTSKETEETNNK